MLTRDAIMATTAPALGSVEVPEWGGAVALRHLSLDDLMAWQEARQEGGADHYQRTAAVVVHLTAASPDGARLFGPDDLPWLMAQPGPLLNRISTAAIELNGLSPPQQEAAGK